MHFQSCRCFRLKPVVLLNVVKGPGWVLTEILSSTGKFPSPHVVGLKARGHPVGATGMYQIVEAVQQLRGEAAPTQVEGARIGMTQNIGGSGATIITHILTSD